MSQALPLVAYPDLEGQVKAMEEDGYAYLPKVIEGEQLAELRAAMDRLTAIPESFDRHGTPENGNGFLNKHINNAFNRDPVFLQYLDFSPVIELAEAVHGEDCHVIGMTAWVTGPGRPIKGYTRIGCRSPTCGPSRRSTRQGANFHLNCPLLLG